MCAATNVNIDDISNGLIDFFDTLTNVQLNCKGKYIYIRFNLTYYTYLHSDTKMHKLDLIEKFRM